MELPSVERVVADLAALQKLGSRAVANPQAANASVAYVEAQLRALGLRVWLEPLTITDQRDAAAPTLAVTLGARTTAFAPAKHFLTATGSASGAVAGARVAVVASRDWADSLAGPAVALVVPPSALDPDTFCQRIEAALASSRTAAVLLAALPTAKGYPNPEAPSGRIRCPSPLTITVPVLSLGQEPSWLLLSAALANPSLTVSLSAKTALEQITVYNILAESSSGSSDSVVVFGSHLDCVRAGPGVNDDGSGAIATLELARLLDSFEKSGHKSVQVV
ncbi:hypothetical protein HK100_001367 [Physocladia obscura]|uniref:Peptide hydrolase n=1 Tax=Physocladia obscura TaxID=109957 RepID=A0AAD5XEW9_9FUNG|nr:hypothetical protein HK100_001367 [Physocladia obscura]